MKIDDVRVGAYRIPLPGPMQGASTGVMRAFDMVLATVVDSDGCSGLGYTVMHEGQGPAIATMIRATMRPELLGDDPRLIERI